MAYELNFDLKTSGLSDVQKIETILASIKQQSGAADHVLKILEETFKKDAAAGRSLESTLRDVTKWSKDLGTEVSGAARNLLEQAAAAQKAEAAIQQLGRTQESAAREDARRTAQSQAQQQRLGALMDQAQAENKKRTEAANAPNPTIASAGRGFALGTLGLGVIGGVGLQAGMAAANALRQTVAALTTGFAEESRETQILAERLGITSSKTRELENIAAIAGVNIGTLSASSRILSNALEDSNGSGKKAAAALRELGISTGSLTKESVSEGQVMTDLLDKLSKLPDQTERTRLGNIALGRSYKEIAPLVDELTELRRRYKDLGIEYTDSVINQGAEAEKSFKQVGLSFKFMIDKLAQKIAPIIIPLNFGLARFAATGDLNNSVIGPMVAEAAASIALQGNPATKLTVAAVSKLAGAITGIPADAGALPTLPGAKVPSDPGNTADPARAAANRTRYLGTEEGLNEQLEAAQAKLAAARKLNQDSDKSQSNIAQGEIDEKAAQKEITSLQSRIDAIKNVGKAAEAAARAVEEFNKRLREQATEGKPVERAVLNAVQDVKDAPNADLKRRYATLGTQNIQSTALEYAESQGDSIQKEVDRRLQDLSKLFEFNLHLQISGLEKAHTEAERIDREWDTARRSEDTAQISGVRDYAQKQSRLLGIRSSDQSPITLALQQLSITQQAIAAEAAILEKHKDIYDLDARRYELQKQMNDAQFAFLDAVAAKQKATNESFANGVVSLAHSIESGKTADFFKSIGNRWTDQIIKNLAGEFTTTSIYKNVTGSLHNIGDNAGSFGKFLNGTPFEADPLKSGHAAAIDRNTGSLDTLTGAVADLYASITGNNIPGISTDVNASAPTGGLLGGGGGLFGGGSLGNGIYSLAGSGTIGLPAAGTSLGLGDPSKLYAGIFGSGAASGQTYSGLSGLLGGLGHTGDLQGISTGVSAASNQTLSTTERLGAGIGTAGAFAAGTMGAISGFSKGGARGDLQGVGSILGAAASIPGPQQPFLAAGALLTGLISSLFGDPRQNRANQITKELGNAKYEAPVALNETVDQSGNYQDYGQYGQVRSSSFRGTPMVSQPYQWYHNGQYLQYPGEEISPFQNPDLVTPPQSVNGGTSVENPEGVGPKGGTVTIPPAYQGPQVNVTIQAIDAASLDAHLSKASNLQVLAKAMTSVISGGHGSTYQKALSRSMGLR